MTGGIKLFGRGAGGSDGRAGFRPASTPVCHETNWAEIESENGTNNPEFEEVESRHRVSHDVFTQATNRGVRVSLKSSQIDTKWDKSGTF